MDLGQIAETLAKKHSLGIEEYLNKSIADVYPANQENKEYNFYKKGDDDTLIPEERSIDDNLDGEYFKNFFVFLEEINPILERDGYKLIYMIEILEEGLEDMEEECRYLHLYHTPQDKTSKQKVAERKNSPNTDIYQLGGSALICIDTISFLSTTDNPKLEEVFQSIKYGYDLLLEQNPSSVDSSK